jgi:hypothetical protein
MTNPASQQPAPIPTDLQGLYRVVSAYAESGDYAPISPAFAKKLIERIARLEAALRALRTYMWAEGYADQSGALAQTDAALAPLGTPGSTK